MRHYIDKTLGNARQSVAAPGATGIALELLGESTFGLCFGLTPRRRSARMPYDAGTELFGQLTNCPLACIGKPAGGWQRRVRREQAETYLSRLDELLLQLRQLWRCEERAGLLSWPQRVLLRYLHRHGPTHPHVLAHWLGVTRSTLTGLLDGLETRGFIQRTPGRQDRRTLWVSLTDQGARAVAELEQARRHRALQALMTLEPSEAEVLVRALEKLVDAWRQQGAFP